MGWALGFLTINELRDGGTRRQRRYQRLIRLLLITVIVGFVVSV